MVISGGTARGQRQRSGIATVEFAIVAVVLVLLTVGIIEVARGLMVKEYLSNAARRGCRTGIMPGGASSAINTDIEEVLAQHGMKFADATVTIKVNDKTADASTAAQNDKVSVKVSIPAAKVTWITPLYLAAENIQSETVVMMRQR